MTTAQLTSRINLDLYRDGPVPGVKATGRTSGRTRAAVVARTGGALAAVIPAVAGRLEKSDTLADRVVGYGACGLTMVYLVGNVIKAIF